MAGAGGKAITNAFVVFNLSLAEAIEIYPNPTKAALTINWYKANFKVESVSIYNSVGKLVFGKDLPAVPNDDLQLKLSPLTAGIYIMRLQTSAGPVIKRVVVL